MKLGNNIYKFIKSLLADVTVQVRVGGSLSGTVEIENGTPQGAVLSPILFILMLNDISTEVPGPDSCRLSLLADDAAPISQAEK